MAALTPFSVGCERAGVKKGIVSIVVEKGMVPAIGLPMVAGAAWTEYMFSLQRRLMGSKVLRTFLPTVMIIVWQRDWHVALITSA